MSLENKVGQLIKMAEVFINGKVDEFPKNLINFKLILESVKMELEVKETKITSNITAGAEAATEKTSPVLKDEVATPELAKPKRTRRTKAQMEAAKAIDASLEAVEQKIDSTLTRIKEAGENEEVTDREIEDIAKSVSDAIKAQDVNKGDQEDWEKEVPTESEADEIPFNFDDENKITDLINKYPSPFVLELLQTRKEKMALVTDMRAIKEVVQNETTADIKEKLAKFNLDDAVAQRAYKFLMMLPHMETQI